MQVTSGMIRSIDTWRIKNGQSMSACARDIGVSFDTYWNALNRPANRMRDFNEAKYMRYYTAHEREIAEMINMKEVDNG